MMNRIVILLLVMVGVLEAQRSDTIYKKIVNNFGSGTLSVTIPNIGQSQHTLFFVYTDSGGSCTMAGTTARIWLEASHDGSNWIRISPLQAGVQNTTGTTWAGVITANSNLPIIRPQVGALYTNCVLNAWYSGSIPTTSYPQALLANSSNYTVAGATAGGIGNWLIVQNLSTNGRLVVYGIDLYLPGTQDVTLFESSATDCSVTSGFVWRRTTTDTLPTAVVPWHISSPGTHLCMALTTASVPYMKLVYRNE